MSNDLQPAVERLQEIREQEEKATPGPWVEVCGVLKHYVASSDAGEELGFSLQEFHWRDGREVPAHENCQFIAHAREDIPYLLAEVTRLLERVAKGEALAASLVELHDAMVRYEIDCDGDAPEPHRAMMARVRTSLADWKGGNDGS